MTFLYTVLHFMLLYTAVDGHARLIEPPSRSSMWRAGFNNPKNTNDHSLFCGGASVQWKTYGGKCGVCGESYGDTNPANEPGGKYANGIIVRTYKPGDIIPAKVELTANHVGYFEFRLCQNDDIKAKVKQDCFDKNLLVGEDGTTTRFPVNRNDKTVTLSLRLPTDVQCKDCVFQWRYTAGNNWGTDPDGTSCLGCGEQETFQACADIAIQGDTAPPDTDTSDNESEEDEEPEEDDELLEDTDANVNCDCMAAATPAVCHNLYSRRWSNRH